jgi:hypothetical protein
VSKPAAHIFVTELPANAANGALATGFAAGLPDVGTTVARRGPRHAWYSPALVNRLTVERFDPRF